MLCRRFLTGIARTSSALPDVVRACRTGGGERFCRLGVPTTAQRGEVSSIRIRLICRTAGAPDGFTEPTAAGRPASGWSGHGTVTEHVHEPLTPRP